MNNGMIASKSEVKWAARNNLGRKGYYVGLKLSSVLKFRIELVLSATVDVYLIPFHFST